MMIVQRLICGLVAAICAGLLFFAVPPHASGGLTGVSLAEAARRDDERIPNQIRRGELVPMEQVVRRIRRTTDGRLLDATLDRRRMHYRIRWLRNNGEVQLYIVDARTGRILSVRRGGRGY